MRSTTLGIKNRLSWQVSLSVLLLSLFLLVAGCASVGKITNASVKQLPENERRYSFKTHVERHGVGDVFFVLSFSGGGTRAAALSYGVLEELAATSYVHNGTFMRLIDEVDRINGVSGGSFTAAYYGLFGEEIFETYRDDFLHRDIESELAISVFNIFNLVWRQVSRTSRTEDAIRIYDKHVFKGKTFADLLNNDNPFILINASDLTSHDQFVFHQDYLDFFCSDLSDFKVARAVAASSAVPVIFEPVLIQKYEGCNFEEPAWLIRARERAALENDVHLKEVVNSIDYYLSPDNRSYANLVDGGVTDNLGLRPVLNNIMLFGGTEVLAKLMEKAGPFTRIVVLIVNASTTAETEIGITRKLPSITDTLAAVTDIQLHKYNLESKHLVTGDIQEWAESISTEDQKVVPYIIELSIDDAREREVIHFFNKIPTSFSLNEEQVEQVIQTGKYLLRQHPEYKRLLQDLGAEEK